jgi:hypothetical protein
MASENEIIIERSDEDFFNALENLQEFLPYLENAMTKIMSDFKDVASVYAPESEANRPGRFDANGRPMGFYERGRGWWYPIIGDGKRSVIGKEAPPIGSGSIKTKGVKEILDTRSAIVRGYRLRETSEQMDTKWETEVVANSEEVLGYLRNTASYADYVQGANQTLLHKSRDWRTVFDSWLDDKLQGAIDEATTEAINKFFGL